MAYIQSKSREYDPIYIYVFIGGESVCIACDDTGNKEVERSIEQFCVIRRSSSPCIVRDKAKYFQSFVREYL